MKLIKRLFLLGLFVVIFFIGYYAGDITKVCRYCPPEDIDMEVVWETLYRLKENYIDSGKINEQELIWGAAKGMVAAVGDPYTVFFPPEEAKKFLEDVSGEFEGVGMEIGIRDGQLQVISPIEGTPASQAGLRPGDKILKIDDKTTLNMPAEEAVSLIRGPKGTEVVLTILRSEWETSSDFTIKRQVIKIPSLKWELISNNASENIAYIRLYNFSEKIDSDFKNAVFEISQTQADRIILDLRSNPGGYLQKAQDIAGWFLEKDNIVVIEDYGIEKEKDTYLAKGNSKFLNYPTVVIINEGTASASEILAATLRDNRGIKIVGKTSYGKGSVQKLEYLKDGSSLKVTVAKWLTPLGEHIAEKGLTPDFEVDLTEEDYSQDKDPQLDKALEIIKQIR